MIAVAFLCQGDPVPPQPCLSRLVQDIEGDADRVLKDRAVGADPRQDAQAVQGVDQEAGQGSRSRSAGSPRLPEPG